MITIDRCPQCGDPLQSEDEILCRQCDHVLMAAAEMNSPALAVKIIKQYFTKQQVEEIVRALWRNREKQE